MLSEFFKNAVISTDQCSDENLEQIFLNLNNSNDIYEALELLKLYRPKILIKRLEEALAAKGYYIS